MDDGGDGSGDEGGVCDGVRELGRGIEEGWVGVDDDVGDGVKGVGHDVGLTLDYENRTMRC